MACNDILELDNTAAFAQKRHKSYRMLVKFYQMSKTMTSQSIEIQTENVFLRLSLRSHKIH